MLESPVTASAFHHLYHAKDVPDLLLTAYDGLLNDLFQRTFWKGGSTEFTRIRWNDGRDARVADAVTFGSAGLYLWGIENRPIYIGITRQAFTKRFSRYVWSKRSQCNLARDFESVLVSDGINGFPAEIRGWYARHFRGSTVRLLGAVRFAKEGISKIWFALLPHDQATEIRALELALIPVAERWNAQHGLRPLINKQK